MNEGEDVWAGWMRSALAGDEAAYRRLLAAIVPVLRGVTRRGLIRNGQSPDDAEDIVQDILIAVHSKRHTWRPDAAFSPWLHAVARNKLTDALRRRGRRSFVPIEDFENSLAAPADVDIPGESPAPRLSDVAPYLERLGPRQRGVVRAVVLEGRSISATASSLAMSEGAVRVALHRGITALAALVKKDGS